MNFLCKSIPQHNIEIPLLNYNNESDLAAVVNLVYLSSRDFYQIEREDKAGIGWIQSTIKS